MGYLTKLEVSNRIIRAARPRRVTDTVEYRRQKLIANIEEQIELASLVIQNKTPVMRRKRGHRVVEVRPRIWWKTVPDGGVFVQIRYNKVALDIDGRGTSIEATSLEQLPTIYRTVIKAVEAGELDHAIDRAAIKSRP